MTPNFTLRHPRPRRTAFSAFHIAFLFFIALTLHGATVTTRLERPTALVGETITLEVRIENGNAQTAPAFPRQANLTIDLAGNGNQTTIINGKFSTANVLSYAVTAMAPGTYTIPAVNFTVDGATASTQPVRLIVGKDDPANAAANSPAFMRLIVSKTNVYVGELIPIDIRVYGLMIDELQVPVLKSDGFTIGAQLQGSRGREQVGNNIYNVYSFPMSVAPAKAGTLMLGPAEAAMAIRVPSPGRRGNLFEEMMGGSFQRRQYNGTTEQVAINVMPLPSQNRPADFNGAVGNFTVAIKASPTEVAVGDPITLQITVQGEGTMDTVRLPDFGWKDFTFYTPNSTTTNVDALGTRGIKTFDQVIVPTRAGISAIPPLTFSFFDPQARQYKTVRRPAIPITVKATGQGLAQPTVVAGNATPDQPQQAANDIAHIKPALGQLSFINSPAAARPWFIALQLLPVALWGGALAWRKREESIAKNPRLRRQKEVARFVAENLPKLHEHAANKESDAFFALTFRLLQEQIGERLDAPAASITESVVDDRLPKLGATPEMLTRVEELFHACNQARYAGASAADMEALIPNIESALLEVRALPSGGQK